MLTLDVLYILNRQSSIRRRLDAPPLDKAKATKATCLNYNGKGLLRTTALDLSVVSILYS